MFLYYPLRWLLRTFRFVVICCPILRYSLFKTFNVTLMLMKILVVQVDQRSRYINTNKYLKSKLINNFYNSLFKMYFIENSVQNIIREPHWKQISLVSWGVSDSYSSGEKITAWFRPRGRWKKSQTFRAGLRSQWLFYFHVFFPFRLNFSQVLFWGSSTSVSLAFAPQFSAVRADNCGRRWGFFLIFFRLHFSV